MLLLVATNRKLAEARFFLFKLESEQGRLFSNEPEAYEFYLSAFLSAARSVSYALQAEEKDRYDIWFPGWQSALTPAAQELFAFFNEQRVHTIHRKGAEVSRGSEEVRLHEYLRTASREGVYVEFSGPAGDPPPIFSRTVRSFRIGGTEVEVTRACREYFTVVAQLVDAFAKNHSYGAAT